MLLKSKLIIDLFSAVIYVERMLVHHNVRRGSTSMLGVLKGSINNFRQLSSLDLNNLLKAEI